MLEVYWVMNVSQHSEYSYTIGGTFMTKIVSDIFWGNCSDYNYCEVLFCIIVIYLFIYLFIYALLAGSHLINLIQHMVNALYTQKYVCSTMAFKVKHYNHTFEF